jgi:hypothetical protein
MLSICVKAFWVIKLFCYAKFFLFRISDFTSGMMNAVQLELLCCHLIVSFSVGLGSISLCELFSSVMIAKLGEVNHVQL